MLTSRPIIAFVATAKPARAKKFYQQTLGLLPIGEDNFAIVFDAGGTMLRVAIVPEVKPAGYTVLGWMVDDIEQTVRALRRRGVRFQKYPGMGQDRLGIWSSPSGARIAWFVDPDGNTLSLTQMSQLPGMSQTREMPRGRRASRRS